MRTALVLVLALVAIQFVPVERTNPPVVYEVPAPPEVVAVLRRACYDCHSHETRWPWYSRVAPVSWLVVGHVDHGRGDLNFSAWPMIDLDAEAHALREIGEVLSDGEMPPWDYLLVHPDAKLSREEIARIIAWTRSG